MNRTTLAAMCFVPALFLACGHEAHESQRVGANGAPGSTNNAPSYVYASGGDGGTVTVASGRYVSSVWAEGSGTVVITPASPGTRPVCFGTYSDAGYLLLDGGWKLVDGGGIHNDGGHIAKEGGPCSTPGPVINVGSGVTFTIAANGNGLRGASNELADGTKIVFSAGTKYVVGMNVYGPQ